MIDNGTHSCLSCFEIIKSNAKLSRVKDKREREMVNVYMQTDKQKNNIETKGLFTLAQFLKRFNAHY